jgi:putative transcriptional regulator
MVERVENDVRKLRFLNGEMTQEELARRVGVSRQTVIAIEKGKYNPSVALALRIADVFGLPVEEVFWLPGCRRYDTAGGEGGRG